MEPPPELQTVTSASFLEGLKDVDDQTRWQEYIDRYRPVMLSVFLQRGLEGEDAEDLAQVVLLEFSNAYRAGKYDPQRGRLRAWLFGIVYRQLASFHRDRARKGPSPDPIDTRVGDGLASEDELEAQWNEEWHRAVLEQSLAEVRLQVQPQTFRAFEEFALKGRPAAHIAEELEMTENAVFGAKRRVAERLREILPLMEDIW